ncbi:MAG: DegV family protein [Anaerolineae bacterium]|jgi:fatty acid-binding protein DegV|nr:DegV family protein [Anaerolineae bacterium]MDH7475478.1 DegV family protein [Anaerolineae bacterium]
MVPLHIVTDSTADIPPHIAAELNITVLPCLIAFGHETYRDGIDMTNTEFYAKITTSSVLPTTSHPSWLILASG